MKKYLYEYLNDMSGEEKIFETKEEALKYAKDYFNHLTSSEKKGIEYMYVIEIEVPEGIDNDDLLEDENLEDKCWTADVWDYNTEKIAEKMRSLDTWDYELCSELCFLAGLFSEYENADGETFESVVFKAAEILNVEIQ